MAGASIPGTLYAYSESDRLNTGLIAKAAPALPGPVVSLGLVPEGTGDISTQFTFRRWTDDEYSYVQAAGDLGTPGFVKTHRIRKAQTEVSEGTGEHAGHLIAIQFGAPGDSRNLGLQNPNMNTFAPKVYQEAFGGSGGSYHKLESSWKDLLLDGWKVFVVITDKYHAREDRPFTRSVFWTEFAPSGESESFDLDFGNFSSPQKRNADNKPI